ncbi:unnamed protein product [Prorocentrum cordatum]|uniref:Uncharacterized protein n=1 Tax=Prorocentrum cordatum TaxID=2364126 RepID=A0ABN9TT83_9DINO|nr:unnamed protein product [Polarella glacialis]
MARGSSAAPGAALLPTCTRSKNAWRMWESFLGICMQLRDVQGCVQAMRRLVDLDQAGRIQERILGLLTSVVVGDVDGLYDSRTGGAFAKMLTDFLRHLTSKISSQPCYWRFLAELQDAHGNPADAVDSRLKQVRAAQAKMWEERDPALFATQLEDFKECLLLIDKGLAEPCPPELARHLHPFAYCTREVRQRLTARRDSGDWRAAWAPALESIAALADRLEARVSIPEGKGTEEE